MKTRQMGAIPPSAILSQKGIARYGGVSHTGPLSNCVRHVLSLCCPWPPRGPENPRKSSRSKVGPKVGFGP